MAKKASALKIVGATFQTPAPAERALTDAAPATGGGPLVVAIEVQNSGTTPLHVWETVKQYDYDAATRKLTLYLTEHTPPLPPGITMISDHPHTPRQVEVAPGATGTIHARVPRVVRRRTPAGTAGASFVEEPLGPIEQVEAHIQSGTAPVRVETGEHPAKSRERLREHGETVQTTIRMTGNAGQKER